MNLVVDRLAQVLAATPNPVLATERVGTKTPAALADIPRVSVALELEPPSGTGIGRIAREGHIVTKHVQVVSIADPDSGFDESLTRWRLDPLPIKKNPDSPHRGLGGDDILVRNLATDTQYLFTEAPEEQTEFRFDPNGAVLVFGRAQATGESLEVQHWTLTLRDDIVPERYRGRMMLTSWGRDFQELDQLSRALLDRLSKDRRRLVAEGFERLVPLRLGPAEQSTHDALAASPFSLWRQEIAYAFDFDVELGGDISAGGRIQRIDVDMDKDINEPFAIGSTTSS